MPSGAQETVTITETGWKQHNSGTGLQPCVPDHLIIVLVRSLAEVYSVKSYKKKYITFSSSYD